MATNGRDALHLATHSGWYRFERKGEAWVQTDRSLTFWQMSCIQVDPENLKRVYIGTEHSGMFVTDDGGKDWTRANPNVPCLTMSSMLALSASSWSAPCRRFVLYDGRRRVAGLKAFARERSAAHFPQS